MAKSMTKSAIITHLSQKTTLSKKQINDVMDQLLCRHRNRVRTVGRFFRWNGLQDSFGGLSFPLQQRQVEIQKRCGLIVGH